MTPPFQSPLKFDANFVAVARVGVALGGRDASSRKTAILHRLIVDTDSSRSLLLNHPRCDSGGEEEFKHDYREGSSMAGTVVVGEACFYAAASSASTGEKTRCLNNTVFECATSVKGPSFSRAVLDVYTGVLGIGIGSKFSEDKVTLSMCFGSEGGGMLTISDRAADVANETPEEGSDELPEDVWIPFTNISNNKIALSTAEVRFVKFGGDSSAESEEVVDDDEGWNETPASQEASAKTRSARTMFTSISTASVFSRASPALFSALQSQLFDICFPASNSTEQRNAKCPGFISYSDASSLACFRLARMDDLTAFPDLLFTFDLSTGDSLGNNVSWMVPPEQYFYHASDGSYCVGILPLDTTSTNAHEDFSLGLNFFPGSEIVIDYSTSRLRMGDCVMLFVSTTPSSPTNLGGNGRTTIFRMDDGRGGSGSVWGPAFLFTLGILAGLAITAAVRTAYLANLEEKRKRRAAALGGVNYRRTLARRMKRLSNLGGTTTNTTAKVTSVDDMVREKMPIGGGVKVVTFIATNDGIVSADDETESGDDDEEEEEDDVESQGEQNTSTKKKKKKWDKRKKRTKPVKSGSDDEDSSLLRVPDPPSNHAA